MYLPDDWSVTVMNYLIFDLAILVIVILFALWGRHRGLILSVFSLVTLIVAIIGGQFVSKLLTPTVVTWIQPTVEKAVSEAVDSAVGEIEDALGDITSSGIFDFFTPDDPVASTSSSHASAGVSLLASAEENSIEIDISLDSLPLDLLPEDFSVDDLKEYLQESGLELPEEIEQVLTLLDDETLAVMAEGGSAKDVALSMAMEVAEAIVHAILFLLAFVLILILLHVLARVLNLISKLPVLNTMNKLGGFVFGILQGLLVVSLCVWVLRILMTFCVVTIPETVIEESTLLEFFLNFELMNTLPSF